MHPADHDHPQGPVEYLHEQALTADFVDTGPVGGDSGSNDRLETGFEHCIV
jgi:hypothetical protein